MSARNRLDAKRQRRASRSLRKGRLDTYCDLLGWMKLRANLTTSECRRVAMAGALQVDSHKVGIAYVQNAFNEKVPVFQRFVPTALVGLGGKNIRIVRPKVLDGD